MRWLGRCLTLCAVGLLVVAGVSGFAIRLPGPSGGPGGGRPMPLVPSGHPTPRPSPHHTPPPHGHHHHPHGCQPQHVFVPHGFKPLHASNAQLLAHGFPPRPPKSQHQARNQWMHVIGRARRFEVPHPVCGTGRRGTVYSGNWAGRVVPRSDFGFRLFTASQSEWVQPSVPGDTHYHNYNDAPTVSIWTGVGVANLMQAGVDSISTVHPRYRFWTEDFPQNMVWEGPRIRGGQTAFVYVRNAGRHRAYYFLENVTTGAYSTFSNSLPYVGTNAANFVLERPNGLYLPAFRSLSVWDSYFWQRRTSYQLTAVSNRWIMTSNCASGGVLLARPTGVSGGQFRQAWRHSRPFSNFC
jgi:hypothetical protein